MSDYIPPRDRRRKASKWDHSEPDIREAKRRVAGWILDHTDPLYKVHKINGKHTPPRKMEFNHS